MKSTIAKKTEGYGYKYTELADINKYCEDNGIRYWQEVETCEINQKDYIITYLVTGYTHTDDKGKLNYEEITTKHRGCQIVDAVLQGIKNPVQEYGSSLTYCRRYSLLMALGLATEDDDASSLTQQNDPTKEDAEKYVITFGKYNGKLLSEVIKDSWYKNYLLNGDNEYIKKCIELLTGDKMPDDEEQKERLELINDLNGLVEITNTDYEKFLAHYKVESNAEMTTEQLKEAVEKLKGKLV